MSLELLVAVIGALSGATAFATALIRVGQEKQARVDLERRHGDLAKEFRDTRHDREKLSEKVNDLDKKAVERETELKNLQHRMQEKASVESVEALRETVGRIEGTLNTMAHRLDSVATKILKED